MNKLNYKRASLHTGFWLSILTVFFVIYGPVFDNYPWLFLSSVVMLPFTMTVVYTTNYVLLPKFLKEKQYSKLASYILLMLIIVPLISRITVMKISNEPISLTSLFDYNLLPFYFTTGLITFAALTIKLVKEDKLEREQKNQLEKEKLKVELSALKTQLNAHFLFNTLNNLYGLTIKKSDLAPKAVLMLSDMLNFVLYETSSKIYSLQKELEFIDNYIELEKLRYGRRLDIAVEKNIEYSDTKISPLLLFPFVENSFKHGARKSVTGVWIKIRVTSTLNKLIFEIENSREPDDIDKENDKTGLGLDNIKRRLELLYPSRHKLRIVEEKNKYSVLLTIIYNM